MIRRSLPALSGSSALAAVRPGRRRAGAALLAGGALAMGLPARSQAQPAYPSRPVRVLVPYGAGGSADNAARIVAKKLAIALGQPFVIENRPGASGTLAAGALAQSASDGHTLMVAPTAVAAITPVTALNPPNTPKSAGENRRLMTGESANPTAWATAVPDITTNTFRRNADCRRRRIRRSVERPGLTMKLRIND